MVHGIEETGRERDGFQPQKHKILQEIDLKAELAHPREPPCYGRGGTEEMSVTLCYTKEGQHSHKTEHAGEKDGPSVDGEYHTCSIADQNTSDSVGIGYETLELGQIVSCHHTRKEKLKVFDHKVGTHDL